jgi:hypothetical protein
MIQTLRDLLSFLNDTLDIERQRGIESLHKKVLNWEEVDRLPIVMSFPYPKEALFQPFPHREIFANPEKMLFNELTSAWGTSIALRNELNDDLPLTIRANFGTVLVASLFGARVEQVEDNPPWVRSFKSLDEFRASLESNPDDIYQGWIPKVFDLYTFYHQVLSDYPNLQDCMNITLPDLQGPIDTLELLRGSDIFSDFFMDLEIVTESLPKITKAQINIANGLKKLVVEKEEGYNHQHGFTIKGNLLIRNDSSMMLSPDLYEKYVAPFDQELMQSLGGGAIHSCGKIDHMISSFLDLPSIESFDFGQSHLNDMDIIYPLAKEKKVPLIRVQPSAEELKTGSICKRFPTGVSLFYEAKSFEEAKFLVQEYKK